MRFYGPAGDHNQELINSLSEGRQADGRVGAPGGSEHKSKSRPNHRDLDIVQSVGRDKTFVKFYRILRPGRD